MFSNELNSLIETDALREIVVGDRRCLIHRDHRWTLVLLHWAQEQGLLPRPCNLVMFDAHHDALRRVPGGSMASEPMVSRLRFSSTYAPRRGRTTTSNTSIP